MNDVNKKSGVTVNELTPCATIAFQAAIKKTTVKIR